MTILVRMIRIKTAALLVALSLLTIVANAQTTSNKVPDFSIIVLNERSQPIEGATVKLLQNNKLIKGSVTNTKGIAQFETISRGVYIFLISHASYQPQSSKNFQIPSSVKVTLLG
jgi:iron complex outermembrane receptor protein